MHGDEDHPLGAVRVFGPFGRFGSRKCARLSRFSPHIFLHWYWSSQDIDYLQQRGVTGYEVDTRADCEFTDQDLKKNNFRVVSSFSIFYSAL